MLQAPPPSWGCQGQGQGVQGSPNAVGSSLEAQVHDLSIQLASLHQIMFQQSQSQGILPQFHNTAVHGILPNVRQPVGSPGQRSNRSQNSQLQEGAMVVVVEGLLEAHPKVMVVQILQIQMKTHTVGKND